MWIDMNSLAVSDAVLMLASGFAVFLMAQRGGFDKHHRVTASAAMVGFVLVAIAAFTGSVGYGISESWLPAHEMLTRSAMYLTPLLLGFSLYGGITGHHWQRPFWGRLIIGICVLFEVSRWFGLVDALQDVVMVIAIVTPLVAVVRSGLPFLQQLLVLLTLLVFSSAFVLVGTEGTLAGYLRLDLFRYLVGLGILMISSALYLLFQAVDVSE